MVGREVDALATVRSEDDGLRLRILARMADRVGREAGPAAGVFKVADRGVDATRGDCEWGMRWCAGD